MTLWELIEDRASRTPDGLMLVDEMDRTMTFGDYKVACERAAAGLMPYGVGPDVNVSWQLPTWIESFVLVGALSRLGAIQNPILPIYRSKEVGFVLRQTNAALMIVPSEWRGFDYAGMVKEIGVCDALVCDRELPTGDPVALPPVPTDEDATRWIFFSSGTTAEPKGAQHTDATIAAGARGMIEGLNLGPDDRHGFVFPFTHIGGGNLLIAGLETGMTHYIVEAFDPAVVIPLFQKHEVTLAGAGTFFHQTYLAAQREQPGTPLFPKIRAFSGGGAPKPPQLHYDMVKEMGGVGIVAGYGLTEAPILTMCSVEDPTDKLATTEGRPSPGVQLKLVDGEVRAKGPQVFKGYLDPALDVDAFDEDGWFRTGDLGAQDEGGWLTITGRVKDVIIRKGENISAKEIEDLLFQHDKVTDAAVIGLPDPASGERACAVVVGDITFAEMIGYLKEQGLMTQKLPEQLEHVDALPRNATGKVLKFELQDRFKA
ncbi:MAG TPA: AMP-binding protein [Acidimicrobiales bacterium]|nr:AMP-binding protein [Acidimicrobiales bacterium]